MRKIILPLLLFINMAAWAQEENPNSILSKGIKYKYGENSSVAFHFGTQVWARYMQANPGSIDAAGNDIDNFFDVALRRTRFSMYASFLDDKYVVYTQLGMNGQTFSSSSKPQLYFHDVWSAFQFFDGKLYAGMGLHGWSGVSRLGSASYGKNIMVDHPGFGLPNLGRTDQSGRQLGIFIKGNIAKFNYRFSLDKPFIRNEIGSIGIDQAAYYPGSKNAFKGYVFYSFLDEEIFKSSYCASSYLGKKKIFNIGAGFDYHPELMASYNASGDTLFQDKRLFGVDLFLDYPFTNESVLTLYTAGYFYDFGPNYVRTYSIMNPLENKDSDDYPQGAGNNHYNVGTGTVFYGMVGFILPKSMQPFSGKIQPIAAIHYKNFEALSEPSIQFDAGVNYYISGFNSKVTLQYSNWAVYNGAPGPGSEAKVDDTGHMAVLQVQFYL